MKEQAEQLFWAHDRGLLVTLTPETTQIIGHEIINGNPIPETESLKLGQINGDAILKKRHPNQSSGEALMESVDYQRRYELIQLAMELTSHIVETWSTMNPHKDIAVLLYGSVAKSLVKKSDHESPSDIDLTVIGDLTDSERLGLRNAIQAKRENIRERILTKCTNVQEEAWDDIRYAGTMVQHTSKLTKNRYSDALAYIGSCTRPLHDPSGIWQRIEQGALAVRKESLSLKHKHMRRNVAYKLAA